MEDQAMYDVQKKNDEYVLEVLIEKAGIRQAEIKQFARNVMGHFLDNDAQLNQFEKGARVAEKVRIVLEADGIDPALVDAIVAGTLLARTNRYGEAYPNSHVLEFPLFVKKHGLDEGINEMFLGAITRVVRGSLGPKSPLAEYRPKPGSPEYLTAALFLVEQ